jgi:uncharacterized protein
MVFPKAGSHDMPGHKRKRVLALPIFFLFLLLFPAAGQAALDIPRPVGDIYVQDFANVLTPQEETELARIGRTLEEQTSNQISVLTVPSIGETSIEEYANEAYRTYGLGTRENDNGVLLVLAMDERKIRIEVGYGLEGAIPDGKAGRIIDNYAIPYLQAGKPNTAIMNTYQLLANESQGEYAPNLSANTGQEGGIPSWLLIIIVVGLIFLDITFFGGMLTYALLSILSRGGGGGGPRGGGGGSSGGGGASRGW